MLLNTVGELHGDLLRARARPTECRRGQDEPASARAPAARAVRGGPVQVRGQLVRRDRRPDRSRQQSEVWPAPASAPPLPPPPQPLYHSLPRRHHHCPRLRLVPTHFLRGTSALPFDSETRTSSSRKEFSHYTCALRYLWLEPSRRLIWMRWAVAPTPSSASSFLSDITTLALLSSARRYSCTHWTSICYEIRSSIRTRILVKNVRKSILSHITIERDGYFFTSIRVLV